MLRLAVIGIGGWGRNLLRSFAKKCEVIAVSSTANTSNLKQALALAPEAEPRALEAILADPEIDVLVIAVPIDRLYAVAGACIRSGKHLFIEKPAASSRTEIEQLMQLQQHGQVCQVGFLFTLDPCFLTLKEKLERKRLQSLRWTWKKWGTFNTDILLNLVSHELSTMIALMGKPPSSIVKVELEDNRCDIHVEYSGVKALIHIDRTVRLRRSHSLEAITDRGTYVWSPGRLTGTPDGLDVSRKINLIDQERDLFLNSISGDTSPAGFSLAHSVLETIGRIRACELQ